MNYYVVFTILLTITNIPFINCARILGIVGMPSYSHQVVFRPLWKELSLRGHQVTVMTTDPMRDPTLTNLTEIDWHHSYHIMKKHDFMAQMAKYKFQIWKIFEKFNNMSYELLDFQMMHPDVTKLIENSTEKFDILLMEMFMLPHAAFSARFNCPYIGLTSLDANTYLHEIVGNPINPVVYPDVMLPFEGKLTFLERLASFSYHMVFELIVLTFLPLQNAFISRYFGDGMPSVEDLLKNVSLLFVNANPMLHAVRPLTPSTIFIGGGIHLTDSKMLPKVCMYYVHCVNKADSI